MKSYKIQTAEQLRPILAGFRKNARMTQEDLAMRLGVTQQTYSSGERNAAKMSIGKLLSVLHALDVDLVLQPKTSDEDTASSTPPAPW